MRAFRDTTAAIDEPRSARMEQRTKPHVKEAIQKAAALTGVDETAFVTSAAYGQAQATIAAHEQTILSGTDRGVFFAALDKPAAPTETLREALEAHDQIVVDDDSA